MQIIWDVVTREILVIFRDQVFHVPGRHQSQAEGIAAGEQFCRDKGWGENPVERDSGRLAQPDAG